MANDIKTISAEELHELLFTGKDHAGHDIKLINVLDYEAFDDCHIKGSSNISHNELASYVKDWDHTSPIIVYCASSICPLSKQAYQTLVEMGFTDVTAYEGGMKEWHDLEFPSEGPCVLDYLAKAEPQTETCPYCKKSKSGCECE